ncbi:MAG TPA: hypothetical protein VGC91_09095 [Pyrinomonadaceae bacterium]
MDTTFNGNSQFLPLIGARLIREEAEKSQTKENEESVKATGETVPVDSQHTSTMTKRERNAA